MQRSATPAGDPEGAPSPAGVPAPEDPIGPDTTTKHGIVQADNVVYQSGTSTSDVFATMSGSGIMAFLGGKIGSGGGCTEFNERTSYDGASAGVLTVSTTAQTVTLDPSGTIPHVVYTATSTPTYPFAAGSVSFVAAGGPDVGSFSGSVGAPAPIAGFTPPASILRTTPLALSWTKHGGKIAIYVFSHYSAGGSSHILRCATLDTGGYTISTAALGVIPSPDDQAQVAVVRYADVKETAGTYSVTLLVNQVFESNVVPLG